MSNKLMRKEYSIAKVSSKYSHRKPNRDSQKFLPPSVMTSTLGYWRLLTPMSMSMLSCGCGKSTQLLGLSTRSRPSVRGIGISTAHHMWAVRISGVMLLRLRVLLMAMMIYAWWVLGRRPRNLLVLLRG